MRIEVTEKVLRTTDASTGKQYDLVEGDSVTVSDVFGQRLCALGWAKDAEGRVPSNERKPGVEIVLNPKKVRSATTGRV